MSNPTPKILNFSLKSKVNPPNRKIFLSIFPSYPRFCANIKLRATDSGRSNLAEHRLLFFRGVEFHWFEFFAVGQAVWLVAEVGQDGCAVGEFGLLDGPVRRDENVIRHLRVADRADEAAYILIAFCEAVLVLAPGLCL